MSELIPTTDLDLQFTRSHGVHNFTQQTGREVTVISQPTWGEFATSLQTLDNPGVVIVSPELITSAPESLSRTLGMREEITGRVALARDVSRQYPGSTLLLSSATFDTPGTTLPRNSTLFIKDGQEVGRTHKMPYVGEAEAMAFHQSADASQSQKPDQATVALICSDLLFHRWEGAYQMGITDQLPVEYKSPIEPNVNTLLVSACWATPMLKTERLKEERYVLPLQFAMRSLFGRHPHLQEVIMADRLPSNSTAAAPFNFRCTRKV